MTNVPLTGVPQVIPEPEYDQPLDPKRLRLFRDSTGQLRMTIEGDRSYLDVKVVSAFPRTDPDHHIGLLDGRDRNIGMLNDLESLDEESRKLARQALQRQYFMPEIIRIHELREEFGVVYFVVETDYGRRDFVVKGLRDSLEDLGDGQLLIADADGTRYHIVDWRTLDPRSCHLLEDFV